MFSIIWIFFFYKRSVLIDGGERLPASAAKYTRQGAAEPKEQDYRARDLRQANGLGANDGPAWNIPLGLVLAGGAAIRQSR